MLLASFLRRHRELFVGGIVVFIVFTVVGLQLIPSRTTQHSESKQLLPPHDDGPLREPLPTYTDSALSLPPEYSQPPKEQPFCAERFGFPYLQNLASSSVSYCDANSASSLTCFRTKVDPGQRTDSFCIGGPATYESKKFTLDCSLRQWTAEEASQGIPRLEQFPSYWYATGPLYIFNTYIRMSAAKETARKAPPEPRNFSILIKREKSNYNVWHSLMEVFALYMTLDVLRMTPDPATKRPFFSTEDFANSQVLILDDLLDGPVFDLWNLFAEQPPIRLQDVSDSTRINLGNIIVPLPGGANPFWQGDWDPLPCDRSELLQTFTRRVLDFYKVDDDLGPEDRPLVLTFIDRASKRRLIDQGPYIEHLKATFPAVHIQVVDFVTMTFAEQLKIIRHTDILAGVHGAGLTHAMFLPPHSTIAEILPPGLKHKGFRNLAKKLGHKYFSSHAVEHRTNDSKGDWQLDDIFIEEDRFMELLDIAVKINGDNVSRHAPQALRGFICPSMSAANLPSCITSIIFGLFFYCGIGLPFAMAKRVTHRLAIGTLVLLSVVLIFLTLRVI